MSGRESPSRSCCGQIGSHSMESNNRADTSQHHHHQHNPLPATQGGDACCSMCGETNDLGIIQEIKQAYEERMNLLDANPAGDSDQQRIDTLKKWVKDLSDDNALLAQTVQELEKEACRRVTMLEEKLRGTSEVSQNYMDASKYYNNCLQETSTERMNLEKRLGSLVSDARNLCRLIQQGRQYCDWSTDGMIFYEVNDEEIFGNSTEHKVQPHDKSKPVVVALQFATRDSENKCQQNVCSLALLRQDEPKSVPLQLMIEHKDEQIRDYVKKIQTLQDEIVSRSVDIQHQKEEVHQIEADKRRSEDARKAQHQECQELSCQLKDLEYRLSFTLREKTQLAEELSSVHREFDLRSTELAKLKRDIINVEKAAKDKQAALTAEVAEKHDQISLLRKDAHTLEERCHQADMQTIFKDGVIKELRKEVKFNRVKIAELEERIFNKNPPTDVGSVQGSTLEFGITSNNDSKEHQPVTEKQSRGRPKVSKFFQPNIGDYVPASSHASGDYKPTAEYSKRDSSPPSKDLATRDAQSSRVQEEICALKHDLEIKDRRIAQLEALSKANKRVSFSEKECICGAQSSLGKITIPLAEQVMGTGANQCECGGEEKQTEYRRVIDNLCSSLKRVEKELIETQEKCAEDRKNSQVSKKLDEYAAQFEKEKVATDEMKEEMNNLILNLKEKENAITEHERTIRNLQNELCDAKLNNASNKTSKVCPGLRVSFQEWKPEVCSPKKSKKLGFDNVHDADYQALKDADSLLDEMTKKLEKRDKHVTVQAEIIKLLQVMLEQAEDLQEANSFKCSCEMQQTKVRQQDRIEELMMMLQESEDDDGCHRRAVKREKKPPKILRAASVEEFRIKTVEAQAAVEDMVDEMGALLNNLYTRENKLKELEKVIWTLQQSLANYICEIRKLQEKGRNCDSRKKTTEIAFSKKTERIDNLRKEYENCRGTMTKMFDKLMNSKEPVSIQDCQCYQASANECDRVMTHIAAEVNNAILGLGIFRQQQDMCYNAMNNVQQSLQGVEQDVTTVESEVKSYFKCREALEESREESQRKMDKWTAELENAQEELERNVANYRHTDYNIPEGELCCECKRVKRRGSASCRSNSRNDVHQEKVIDEGVSKACCDPKLPSKIRETESEQIALLSTALEISQKKVADLQRSLRACSKQGQFTAASPVREQAQHKSELLNSTSSASSSSAPPQKPVMIKKHSNQAKKHAQHKPNKKISLFDDSPSATSASPPGTKHKLVLLDDAGKVDVVVNKPSKGDANPGKYYKKSVEETKSEMRNGKSQNVLIEVDPRETKIRSGSGLDVGRQSSKIEDQNHKMVLFDSDPRKPKVASSSSGQEVERSSSYSDSEEADLRTQELRYKSRSDYNHKMALFDSDKRQPKLSSSSSREIEISSQSDGEEPSLQLIRENAALKRTLQKREQEMVYLKHSCECKKRLCLREQHSEEEIVNHCESIRILETALDKAEHELTELRKEIKSLCLEKGASEMAIKNLTSALKTAEDEIHRSKLALPNLQELRPALACGCNTKGVCTQEQKQEEEPTHTCTCTCTCDAKGPDNNLDMMKMKLANENLLEQLSHQQTTISNLQEAVLLAKQQLQEMQGKPLDHCIRDHEILRLYADFVEIQVQYKMCYGEVVKQDTTIELLRDANLDLSAESFHLRLDVGNLDFQLSHALKTLHRTQVRSCLADKELKRKDMEIQRLMDENNLERKNYLKQEELLKRLSMANDMQCCCVQTSATGLDKGIDYMKKQIDQLTEANCNLQREKSELCLKLAEEAKIKCTHIATMQCLRVQISQQKSEMATLKQAMSELKQKYCSLAMCSKERDDKMKTLLQKIRKLENDLQTREAQIEAANEEIKDGKLRVNSLQEKLEAKECEQKHLRTLLDEHNAAASQLRTAIQESNDNKCKLKALQAQLEAKECELERVRTSLDECKLKLQMACCQSQAKDDTISDLTISNEKLKRKLDDAVQKWHCLSTSARGSQMAALDCANRETCLQQQVMEMEEQLQEQLRDKLAEEMRLNSAMDELSGEIRELRVELCEREKQLHLATAKLQCITKNSEKLKEERERAFESRDKLFGLLLESSKLKTEIKRLVGLQEKTMAENCALEEELRQLVAHVQNVQRKNEIAEQKMDKLCSNQVTLQDENCQLEIQAIKLQSEVSLLKDRCQFLQQESACKATSVRNLCEELMEVKMSRSAVCQESITAFCSLQQLNAENRKLQEEKKNLIKSMTFLLRHNFFLKEELQRCRAMLKNWKCKAHINKNNSPRLSTSCRSHTAGGRNRSTKVIWEKQNAGGPDESCTAVSSASFTMQMNSSSPCNHVEIPSTFYRYEKARF